MAADRGKLKNLILYVVTRLQDAESSGATKLNKVLFRAETAAFRELGRLLTGFSYQKNRFGPTLRAFRPVTEELLDERLARVETRPLGDKAEERLCALAAPDLASFSPEELAIVDREIERARTQTAKQMSDEEHETAAWFATTTGDDIRPELTFVEDPCRQVPLSHDEEHWALAAVERFRARAAAV